MSEANEEIRGGKRYSRQHPTYDGTVVERTPLSSGTDADSGQSAAGD
ncbi:hypothetical protein ACAH01_00925 [Halomicrobium sp. HM KBTZ05]